MMILKLIIMLVTIVTGAGGRCAVSCCILRLYHRCNYVSLFRNDGEHGVETLQHHGVERNGAGDSDRSDHHAETTA